MIGVKFVYVVSVQRTKCEKSITFITKEIDNLIRQDYANSKRGMLPAREVTLLKRSLAGEGVEKVNAAYICFRSGVENLRVVVGSADEGRVLATGAARSVCDGVKKSLISGSEDAAYR